MELLDNLAEADKGTKIAINVNTKALSFLF